MATLRVSAWAEKEWRVTVQWGYGETSMGFWDSMGNLIGTAYRYGGRSTTSLIMGFSDSRYDNFSSETIWSSTNRYGQSTPLRKAITFDLDGRYDFRIAGVFNEEGQNVLGGESKDDGFSISGTTNWQGNGKTVQAFVDGVLIGESKVVNGQWSVPTTQHYADGKHKITAIIDRWGWGKTTQNTQVTIDTAPPDVDVNVLVKGLDGQQTDFTAGTISNASSVMLSGTVAADAVKVEVFLNGVSQGNASVSEGQWAFQLNGLTNGQPKVEIRASDRVGNTDTAEITLNKVDLNNGQTWNSKSGWGIVDVAQAYENLTGQTLIATTDPTYVAGQTVDANLVGHVQGVHAAGIRGQGITVAILDTGIRSEFFNSAKISSKSYNFVDNNNDVTDHDGHGTTMASVIGENTLNNGVQGLATDAQLLILKFADTRFTANQHAHKLADAIIYAVDNGADVISMSWTESTLSSPMKWALEYAQSKDVIMVSSGGNHSQQTQWGNPALYGKTLDAIVGVGGYGFDAQGQEVLTSDNTVQSNQSFNGIVGLADGVKALDFHGAAYSTSGTSVAAAVTAAQLALLDSVNAHDNYRDVIGSLMSSTHQLQNHAVV